MNIRQSCLSKHDIQFDRNVKGVLAEDINSKRKRKVSEAYNYASFI